MKKGFTILELLVASLLLGMLMTILTMIFTQSSIAWRTGEKTVANLDQVRNNMAMLQYESDNLYLWKNGRKCLLRSPWKETGELRPGGGGSDSRTIDDSANLSSSVLGSLSDTSDQKDLNVAPLGSGQSMNHIVTYSINVKSAGPDKDFNTWDDIWSDPYDLDF